MTQPPNNSGSVPGVVFNPALGRQLRNAGTAKALSISTQSALAYDAAYRHQFDVCLASGQPFNSDDIIAVVGLPPAGCSPNMVGAIFRAKLAQHRGLWRVLARSSMRRAQAHARVTDIYELIPNVPLPTGIARLANERWQPPKDEEEAQVSKT